MRGYNPAFDHSRCAVNGRPRRSSERKLDSDAAAPPAPAAPPAAAAALSLAPVYPAAAAALSLAVAAPAPGQGSQGKTPRTPPRQMSSRSGIMLAAGKSSSTVIAEVGRCRLTLSNPR
jgi:hypothetical protein